MADRRPRFRSNRRRRPVSRTSRPRTPRTGASRRRSVIPPDAPRQRTYPWVVAMEGEVVSRIGPMWNTTARRWMTADEARRWASSNLNCYFEVHEWDTRDPQRASSYVRALRLDKSSRFHTGSLRDGLRPVRRRPQEGGESR